MVILAEDADSGPHAEDGRGRVCATGGPVLDVVDMLSISEG